MQKSKKKKKVYKKSNWTQLLVKRQPDELKQKMHKAEHLF